jgi:hypothetical protein
MNVKLHLRSGRVLTIDTAKTVLRLKDTMRAKTCDCPGCGGACKDKRKSKDQELVATEVQTPGADLIRAQLEIWKESKAMTEQAIGAAIPSARPELERLLQNQTIKISQLEDELFRLVKV